MISYRSKKNFLKFRKTMKKQSGARTLYPRARYLGEICPAPYCAEAGFSAEAFSIMSRTSIPELTAA